MVILQLETLSQEAIENDHFIHDWTPGFYLASIFFFFFFCEIANKYWIFAFKSCVLFSECLCRWLKKI